MESDIVENCFQDIPVYSEWVTIERIYKGWSKDRKFFIRNKSDEKLLLRISDIDVYEFKKKEFENMKDVYNLGINSSRPIDFGTCGDGKYTYSLLSWIEGKSADEVIMNLSSEEQYKYGIEAGKILRKMHTIPAPINQEDWEERMTKKISGYLMRYEECGIRVLNDEFVIKFINENWHLLKNRSQTYQHGDFHIGNLIITPDNSIGVIDFNRWDYGDTVEEFYKMILFSREISIPFAIGQINGYFENGIPDDFFNILTLYVAGVILGSIVWAIPYGSDEVDGMIKRAKMILDDYDNFNTTIPKWLCTGIINK